MKLTRRHLLALGAATSAAAVVGTVGTVVHWWDQPSAADFTQLSADEARFVRAWASAAFPSGEVIPLDGGDAGLDRFFDSLLSSLPATQRKLLKLLLHALDTGSIAMGGARFTQLEQSEARQVFHRMAEHDLAEVRGAVSGLTVLLGMGYSTHPTVAPVMARWHRCGYG